MSEIVTRPFESTDTPRLCEIALLAWKPIFGHWADLMSPEMFRAAFGTDWRMDKMGQIESFCARYPQWCLVTEVDGRIAGFITWVLYRKRAIAEIGNNAVDPEYQGRGIGTQQYNRVLEVFRAEGMKFAMVKTGLDEPHAPARAAYEKAGFVALIPTVTYYRDV